MVSLPNWRHETHRSLGDHFKEVTREIAAQKILMDRPKLPGSLYQWHLPKHPLLSRKSEKAETTLGT